MRTETHNRLQAERRLNETMDILFNRLLNELEGHRLHEKVLMEEQERIKIEEARAEQLD